ncbi:MAG: damage-inducible protein DinB [Bacteroidetes bacterium]|nr:damage-inducible protein DinB [Bacteroidota bacterium]
MSAISKPNTGEYPSYYHTYIGKVTTDDLISSLETGRTNFLSFMALVPADKLEYRYQEGKWTIKELIIHLMDAERIFTYRALRFSRGDSTGLAGFDENEYVPNSAASERSLQSLLHEYVALRQSTIEFFKNLSPEMTRRTGIANGQEISVRSLGYIIPGHEIHHLAVIKERYL